jgi:hypothetical protein
MTMTATNCNDAEGARCAAPDARNLRLMFGLVLTTSIACSIYASIDARGLYHDGVAYLFGVSKNLGLSLDCPARNTVQILREVPIILLSKFTSMTLFQRGQVFTFVLLMLPTMLCAVCWFILPRNRKVWILFPLTYLLIGFAATSMHAIGEAAVATSCFWILLFLFLFRTRSVGSQGLFLLLSIPAFQLHEGAFPLTGVLLFACAMRGSAAVDLRERLFIGVSALFLAAIFAYQIRWIIYPYHPAHREAILWGLMRFEFLYVDSHLNLPLVTGAVALVALTAAVVVYATQTDDIATVRARRIAIAFALFAMAATVAALLIEKSFSPFAQMQARYFPVFVSTALGTVVVLLLSLRLPDRVWMQPTTVVILISLCAAQTAAEVAASRRWHAFVADLQSRLTEGRGLIPWETMLYTGDKRADLNWRLMAVKWTIPHTSIVFAPTHSIKAIIDPPTDTTYRPVDPEKPDQLPQLRGVDYTPYQQFFAIQKYGTPLP